MRYVQLRAFHNVAVHGGFSRAAEKLHLTQPAISDQVRKLESDYDVRLFDRTKKQVTLTEHGEKLLEFTHRMFEIEEKASEFLNAERTLKTGRLNIIADSTHHILHILGPFRKKYPEVFVSIHGGNTAQVLESLYSYRADIGVMGDVSESREFEILPLSSTSIIAFAPKGSIHAKSNAVTLQQLANMPLVLREKGSKTRAKLLDHAASRNIELSAHIEAEGREAVRDIVRHGGGVGIVSEAEFGNDPSFVKIRIKGANLTMDESVVFLKERKDSRLIRAFLPFVKPMSKLDGVVR